MKGVKPFYKTSEFWLHNLGQIVLVLQEAGVIDLVSNKYNWVAPVLQAFLASAYITSRGQAKSGRPVATDDVNSTWDNAALAEPKPVETPEKPAA